MRHRYPFEALHWLRRQRVDQEAALVSEQAQRTAQARHAEARAELLRNRTESSIAESSNAEQVRLNEGQLRAGDLRVESDWRKGADAELRAKVELEARARAARVAQAATEAAARRSLGTASNQAQMIDSHRSSFRAARAAAVERAEEEAVLEQWSARRFPPRRS